MFQFEKFPVYVLAEDCYKLFRTILSHKKLNKNLSDQLDRALSSIALNISEGTGKYSRKEKKRYYEIARGSAQESASIIRLLYSSNEIERPEYDLLYDSLDTVSRMLTGLINKMRE